MKKIIVAVTVLALAGACLQIATAGDRHPVNYSVSYSTYAPAPCAPLRVVCAPAPRVVYVPAPVVYYPQPVYVTPYSHPRVQLGFGHDRSNRGRGHCR